ncbi:olfactory receptor 1L4-like [Alligator sinensis]|uniref:Olfactory receptor 1L4-like n=1 Tax=Alligator sinensis TaxID=38654 RepID=A0A1U8DM13_ALLSI|nr:olfactory receptor 1L4-like [Alligator sinensis]
MYMKESPPLSSQDMWNIKALLMETLGRTNKTLIFKITLLGFRNLHPPQILLLSMAFSMIYVVTVVGNILIVIKIVAEPQLHTPMYFFLANLSCLETCYTTNIIPAMISGFLMEGKHFSINGCLLQAYFFGVSWSYRVFPFRRNGL